MQYIPDVVRPISSLFSLKVLAGCLVDDELVRTWNIYGPSRFILAQDPNKAPSKYKSRVTTMSFSVYFTDTTSSYYTCILIILY